MTYGCICLLSIPTGLDWHAASSSVLKGGRTVSHLPIRICIWLLWWFPCFGFSFSWPRLFISWFRPSWTCLSQICKLWHKTVHVLKEGSGCVLQEALHLHQFLFQHIVGPWETLTSAFGACLDAFSTSPLLGECPCVRKVKQKTWHA